MKFWMNGYKQHRLLFPFIWLLVIIELPATVLAEACFKPDVLFLCSWRAEPSSRCALAFLKLPLVLAGLECVHSCNASLKFTSVCWLFVFWTGGPDSALISTALFMLRHKIWSLDSLWHAAKRQKRKEKRGRGDCRGDRRVGGRWQQWQFVIVMMKTRPSLSLLHIPSLPPSPFSPRAPLSFRSRSVAKNKEVTPLSRTVPYNNSALLLNTHSSFIHIPSSTRHACSLLLPYLAMRCLPAPSRTRRLPIDPICLIVNEQARTRQSLDVSLVYTELQCLYSCACGRFY